MTPERLCTCDALQRWSDDPDFPIRFDAELNEYHLLHTDSRGKEGKAILRYCFSCGGKAPESKRALRFHLFSAAEVERLKALTVNLKTAQDVVAAFGEPDREIPNGTSVIMPGRQREPDRLESFHVLRYESLSHTIAVDVEIDGHNRARFLYRSKGIKHPQE